MRPASRFPIPVKSSARTPPRTREAARAHQKEMDARNSRRNSSFLGESAPIFRLHAGLRRPSRPPRPDAGPQRQAQAAHRLFLRARPIPTAAMALAALTGDLSIASVKPAMLRGLVVERMDEVLFGYSYDYVGDLAETIALVWPAPHRRRATAALSPKSSRRCTPPRAATARALVERWLDRLDASGRFALHQAGDRRPARRRLRPPRQAGAGRLRRQGCRRDRGALARPEAALRRALRLARRARPSGRSAPRSRRSARSCWPTPSRMPTSQKLDPQDYAAEWKWDGIRVQAVGENGVRKALLAHRRRHLRRLPRHPRGPRLRRRRSTASCWSAARTAARSPSRRSPTCSSG